MNVEPTATPPLERPPRRRRTRTWLSRLLFAVCIVLVGFWVQSYRYCTFVTRYPINGRFFGLESWNGNVTLVPSDMGGIPRQGLGLPAANARELMTGVTRTVPANSLGTRIVFLASRHFTVPHWFLVFAIGFVAFAAKWPPRLSFGLLSLFAGVSLFAAVFGTMEVAAEAFAF